MAALLIHRGLAMGCLKEEGNVRKALAGAGAVAAAALALAACSSGSGSSAASSGASGQVTINWSNDASGSADAALWEHLASLSEQKYPNIKINLTQTDWNDYWTKMPVQLMSSSAPCIVTMQMGYLPQFKNELLPITSQMMSAAGINSSDFASVALKALQSDGTQYAIPWDFGPYVVFYNKTEFKAAGLSDPQNGWTLSQFMADAKKLSHGSQYGFMVNDSIDAMQQWGPTLTGEQAVTPQNTLDVDNSAISSALTWYASLVKQKIAAPVVASNQQSTTGSDYLAGNAAMYVDGPWSMFNIKDEAKFTPGVVTMPVGPHGMATTSGGSGFAITKSCSDPAAAMKAISVMTGPAAEAYLGKAGRAFPARTAEDSYWYAGAISGAQSVMDLALKSAVPYRATPTWTQDGLNWTQGVVSVLNGQSAVEPFLQSVESQSQSQ